MTEPHDLARLATPGGDTSGSGSTVDGLLVQRRLGLAAAFAAGVHLLYIVLYRTVWNQAANPVGFWTGCVGCALSSVVAVGLLRGPLPARLVARVAVAYELLLCLALAFSEAWSVEHVSPSPQVAWGAVIIVLFPFLIPARPLVVLGASLGAAAMTPVALASSWLLSNAKVPDADVLSSYVLPPFLCALLAWAPSRALSQLREEVRRARRVGSYELTERLGAGGMGEVWRARHRLLARPAAVKLIRPEALGSDASSRDVLVRRFEREAQVTASLDSPHTVELYDFGVSSDGVLFYVMELLHGLDLETLVERFGPLPAERVVEILMQACDSLEDAHARGLIHRDVKPANLFVSRKGGRVDFVKLLDFGLVKHWQAPQGEAHARTSLQHTGVGQIVGTPAYLAPEAAVGEQGLDHRADLYALGCVGYWLLTGQLVFPEGSPVAMAIAHVTKEPPPPSRRTEQPIPPELEALLMRCLAKEREARPSSAEALRVALAAVPLTERWTRERAVAWWREHLPDTRTNTAP